MKKTHSQYFDTKTFGENINNVIDKMKSSGFARSDKMIMKNSFGGDSSTEPLGKSNIESTEFINLGDSNNSKC